MSPAVDANVNDVPTTTVEIAAVAKMPVVVLVERLRVNEAGEFVRTTSILPAVRGGGAVAASAA